MASSIRRTAGVIALLEVQGEDALIRTLGKLSDSALREVLSPAARPALTPLARAARRNAPYSGPGLRKTKKGTRQPLKKSIKTKLVVPRTKGAIGKVYASREAGYKAYHAHLSQFGTIKQRANPWLSRSVAESKTACHSALAAASRRNVIRVARKYAAKGRDFYR